MSLGDQLCAAGLFKTWTPASAVMDLWNSSEVPAALLGVIQMRGAGSIKCMACCMVSGTSLLPCKSGHDGSSVHGRVFIASSVKLGLHDLLASNRFNQTPSS